MSRGRGLLSFILSPYHTHTPTPHPTPHTPHPPTHTPHPTPHTPHPTPHTPTPPSAPSPKKKPRPCERGNYGNQGS
ncbi:hypothetical protein K9N68_28670 [Kovacikia minuta CCNUW1]|uniref:hypothetical protein n=1 Tax=Kovacikia minuta TaxID=2931930 RepID=UPI001CCCD303|nr:hypothetical protein [Kovacikia minuta]UBF25512.1 hypothetical protein K9N68_28670 [Kovacikia minuta CCNUW1]